MKVLRLNDARLTSLDRKQNSRRCVVVAVVSASWALGVRDSSEILSRDDAGVSAAPKKISAPVAHKAAIYKVQRKAKVKVQTANKDALQSNRMGRYELVAS